MCGCDCSTWLCFLVCPQNTKPMDRSALRAQCEPLLAVAEAHAEGKEAFARSIATELFSDFLSVEERFAANKEATEQEVIDELRQVRLQIKYLPKLMTASSSQCHNLAALPSLMEISYAFFCACFDCSLQVTILCPA